MDNIRDMQEYYEEETRYLRENSLKKNETKTENFKLWIEKRKLKDEALKLYEEFEAKENKRLNVLKKIESLGITSKAIEKLKKDVKAKEKKKDLGVKNEENLGVGGSETGQDKKAEEN